MKDGKMFFGDYRPVNVMRNGIQIAGYTEQEVSGADIAVESTYNDNLSPIIKGNTELKSAWSQSVATSSQVQLTGKNLFDRNALYQYAWVVSAMYVQLQLLPNTQYTLSSNVPQTSTANLYFNGSTTPSNGVWIDKPITQTTDANGYVYIAIPVNPNREYTTGLLGGTYWVQLEIGATATAYEPYCGEIPAPNPSYPQPINTTLPACAYKLPCTQPRGGYWEFTIDADMHGIGSTQDIIAFDKYSGKGWVKRNNGNKIFNGTETWAKNGGIAVTNAYNTKLQNYKESTLMAVCSHFKNNANYTIAGTMYAGIGLHLIPSLAGDTFCATVEDFKSWLAAQYTAGTPVTIVYQLAAPVKTHLTATWVATSTAPDLPDSVTVTDVHTPDYPVSMVGSSGNVVCEPRNLSPIAECRVNGGSYGIPMPFLRDAYNSLNAGDDISIFYNWESDGSDIPPAGQVYMSFTDGTYTGAKNNFIKDERTAADIRFYASRSSYGATYQRFYSIQLLHGTYTADTIPPYAPYRPPAIATFTGDGIGDYRDIVEVWWDTATKRRRVRKTQMIAENIYDGTENIMIRPEASLTGNGYTCFQMPILSMVPVSVVFCTHFVATSPPNAQHVWSNHIRIGGSNPQFVTSSHSDITSFKSGLNIQYSEGTPVKIKYALAAPIVTDITDTPEGQAYLAMTTFPHYIHVYSDCEVKPTITAKIKTIK